MTALYTSSCGANLLGVIGACKGVPGEAAEEAKGDPNKITPAKRQTSFCDDEREMRDILGTEVVDCLLEAVDRGDFSQQQAEDLAGGLHQRARGDFRRATEQRQSTRS